MERAPIHPSRRLPTHMRLFHFSEDPDIDAFVPRPVTVPTRRDPGREWLNGPLVWTVAEHRQALYLFPRDCPRIVLWCTPDTTPEDRAAWFGDRDADFVAYVEWGWRDSIGTTRLHRYELPTSGFVAVQDDWAWVSDQTVVPLAREPVGDLFRSLVDEGVEIRLVPTLRPYAGVWSTSLHASGIRLRNALDWPS